jgi:hypothetical protein
MYMYFTDLLKFLPKGMPDRTYGYPWKKNERKGIKKMITGMRERLMSAVFWNLLPCSFINGHQCFKEAC